MILRSVASPAGRVCRLQQERGADRQAGADRDRVLAREQRHEVVVERDARLRLELRERLRQLRLARAEARQQLLERRAEVVEAR